MCKKTRASSFIFMSFLFNPSLILKSFTYCSRSKFQCFVVYQNEQPLFPFVALIFFIFVIKMMFTARYELNLSMF